MIVIEGPPEKLSVLNERCHAWYSGRWRAGAPAVASVDVLFWPDGMWKWRWGALTKPEESGGNHTALSPFKHRRPQSFVSAFEPPGKS